MSRGLHLIPKFSMLKGGSDTIIKDKGEGITLSFGVSLGIYICTWVCSDVLRIHITGNHPKITEGIEYY